MRSYFVGDLTATAVRPSPCEEEFFDITVRLWCDDPHPGSARVRKLLRTGELGRKGMWHPLSPEDRKAWSSVALWSRRYQRRDHPEDAAPGRVFTLDGRQVVDADGFNCALGEAINGPGGCFGRNLSAVDDCLHGGSGAAPPFTLEWQHSDISRSRPVGDDRGAGAFFEVLPEIFMDRGVDVLLR